MGIRNIRFLFPHEVKDEPPPPEEIVDDLTEEIEDLL